MCKETGEFIPRKKNHKNCEKGKIADTTDKKLGGNVLKMFRKLKKTWRMSIMMYEQNGNMNKEEI